MTTATNAAQEIKNLRSRISAKSTHHLQDLTIQRQLKFLWHIFFTFKVSSGNKGKDERLVVADYDLSS